MVNFRWFPFDSPFRILSGMYLHRIIAIASGAVALSANAQAPLMPMPVHYEESAEAGWLRKPVLASRVLDDMTRPETWKFQGTGRQSFRVDTGSMMTPVMRIDMDMFTDKPAPTRNRLSSINLRREFPGENWSDYNRISFWIRLRLAGFPMLPIQIVLHNDGVEKVPDRYNREGTHYVMLRNDEWQQVAWEITPLARDKVTSIEIGYWVNKMLSSPGDKVAFEIGKLELQRVDPDHHTGWNVAPRKISYSHTGYDTASSKTAIATDLDAEKFRLLRLRDKAAATVVLEKPIERLVTRLGRFQKMDFSKVREPGRYVIEAGTRSTQPFAISGDVWEGTIWKSINFFFAERCGFAVPGIHDVDHKDWFATLGDRRIPLNGGWHDAGDLSQGLINTGEATYAMFALAEKLRAKGGDPALVNRLIEEAKWGLEWVLKVRFPGGYRVAFASHNLWTNGVVGDADDRLREAKNNPNANYIAAAAEAIAYRVLKKSDPDLAARALATAEDDWRHAIVGVENAETRHTVAFAATPMELAGIGILASLELYQATGRKQYADKAIELAPVTLASQQKTFVGSQYPLAGFFYTGPDRDTLFHQFHRGNDQAPIIALTRLTETFPAHPDWMKWYSAIVLYSEYQKSGARMTEPYGVLPSYVYHEREHLQVPDSGAIHMATRKAFHDQVLEGMPMGEGYYLRVFPVWFARRGNFGILLSQAKALSTAAHLRGDSSALDLAQRQAQWIVGRNPFVQSTMYGEGYDWAQQYSVSSGDIVGSLPVGMQSRGNTDLPYWPQQNMYVYKEVWVHSTSRWLWLMEDLMDGLPSSPAAPPTPFEVTATTAANGQVTIRLTVTGAGSPQRGVDAWGKHTFALRSSNLALGGASRTVTKRSENPLTVEWKTRALSPEQPWIAVIVPDGDLSRRREISGRAVPLN